MRPPGKEEPRNPGRPYGWLFPRLIVDFPWAEFGVISSPARPSWTCFYLFGMFLPFLLFLGKHVKSG